MRGIVRKILRDSQTEKGERGTARFEVCEGFTIFQATVSIDLFYYKAH